jgi:hypothetical protein
MTMTTQSQRVAEWHDIDAATFHDEIVGRYRPAILRGFVRHWPAVHAARASPEAICQYLMAHDSGAAVDAILMAPQMRGRLFYSDDMNGFNFMRKKLAVSSVIEQLARYSQFERAPSVAVQSALIADCMPGFARHNVAPLLDPAIGPRIWIGNAFVTPAHFDESDNLACVVSGKRRFTLFPPEQVGNLYVGPLEFAPTPTPISMVDFSAPDLTRFPRFAHALEAAQVAELEPGDALYIPSLWWHHVESIGVMNVLVNYWWRRAAGATPTTRPFELLIACLQGMGTLPPEHRAAWGALFAHYVFDPESDPGAHIAPHKRGVLGQSRPG